MPKFIVSNIHSMSSIEVEADTEQEAFNLAFDEAEWDFDIKEVE